MVNKDRLLDEFIRLVKIDSPTMHEREIADYLKGKLTASGLEVYEDAAGEATGNEMGSPSGNLIATLKGKVPEAPTIMLCAHMDTVEPGRGVNPIIKDGVIYSDGTTVLGSDDKSGISTILEVIEVLREQDISHGDIEVVFTVAEEGGLIGAKNLDHKRLKSDFAYVLDCDGPAGTIITRAPAQYLIKSSIIGKAAHAGISPEEGINAIYIASKAISQMKLGRIDIETTANIGVISGGKATNIIPDLVNIEGETRSHDTEKLERETDRIIEILETTAREFGAKIQVEKDFMYPRLKLDETNTAVLIAMEAAVAVGRNPVLVSTGGGSDANILNGYGIQTVNLGTGMSKVHTTEEFITIDNLVLNVRYILEIIKKAAGKKAKR
ncbi:M20/M25/M40 family metallo-hydrolase [Phosphitispora sp. TUW77]|uniref:M20/M25/M40 family metallo-hydrolase n=1 Tax=Phosphitispora sp. TUW77 TaxID=3152361 RepID=UPI003AB6A3A2